MSDEEEVETVDPKLSVDDHCKASVSCMALFLKYEACQTRIEAKGAGTCTGQYMDWVGCVDHCATHSLFSKLK